jgi:ubiquinone/menaquinone biosynthesis C-methylase UbiE
LPVAHHDTNLPDALKPLFDQTLMAAMQGLITADEQCRRFLWVKRRAKSCQRQAIFENYFRIFSWSLLPEGGGVGIDVGFGTGRWSMLVAPCVGHLHLLDVSPEALAVAQENLKDNPNVSFHANTDRIDSALCKIQ